MESSDTDEDNSSSDAKRKLHSLEDPSGISFKKARYSWQVKGSKGNTNSLTVSAKESSQKTLSKNFLPGTTSLESPSLDKESCYEGNSAVNDQNLFHEMDFTPDDSSGSETVNKLTQESRLKNKSDTFMEVATASESTKNKVKHVETSLHTCLLTGIPSACVTNPSLEASILDHSTALPRRSSAPSIAPSHDPNSIVNTDARDGIEFRDALRSIHRSNLSYYEKWQKRNTAGAIVDNVFNRTIEEMGICPDPVINRHTRERSDVEDQSILAAISSQGLTANRSHSVDSAENRSEESQNRSEDSHDTYDYFRHNPDVFDKTFERLGYFRYDIVHQRNSDSENNVDITERHLEEAGTQTDFQSNGTLLGSNNDRAETSSGAGGGSCTDKQDKDAVCSCDTENVKNSAENMSDNEKNALSEHSTDMSFETNICNAVTTEADSAINDNILNLALSAAIQSQGLRFK